MFQKIKLLSSLSALIIFAFPWVDIQCSEKSLGTQSGFQVVYGGVTPSEEMKSMSSNSSSKDDSAEESMGFAPLVALSLLAVIGAVVFSFVALFRGGKRAVMLSSVLPVAALLLLVIQLMIGFPANKRISASMSQGKSESQTNADGLEASMGNSMAAAMAMNMSVKTRPAFYFELLALGIPALLLANGLIDKYKKSEPNLSPGS